VRRRCKLRISPCWHTGTISIYYSELDTDDSVPSAPGNEEDRTALRNRKYWGRYQKALQVVDNARRASSPNMSSDCTSTSSDAITEVVGKEDCMIDHAAQPLSRD